MIVNIHVINGPNLNLLGLREPHLYGAVSFDEYLATLKLAYPAVKIYYLQSNHEGVLIDYLHAKGFEPQTGLILNAGGLTHTSVSLRDAVAAISIPVVEVHISNIYHREPFRWHSYLTGVCDAHFIGHGLDGYRMAIDHLLQKEQ